MDVPRGPERSKTYFRIDDEVANKNRALVSKEEETRRGRTAKTWTKKLARWLGPLTLAPEQREDKQGESLLNLTYTVINLLCSFPWSSNVRHIDALL